MIAGLLVIIPYIGSLSVDYYCNGVPLLQATLFFYKYPTVFVIEQLIESRLLQPLILGSSLKMEIQ